MILITPVFVAMLVAAVEYVPVLIGQSTLTHAAGEGAREAGKGGNIDDVAAAVNKVLLANNLAVTNVPDSGTMVVLQDGPNTFEFGDPNLTYQLPPSPACGEVRVTLYVLFSAAKIDSTIPMVSPFNVFGFTLNGKRFQVSSLVSRG
jgi:Flp pilus assembly protein TadG